MVLFEHNDGISKVGLRQNGAVPLPTGYILLFSKDLIQLLRDSHNTYYKSRLCIGIFQIQRIQQGNRFCVVDKCLRAGIHCRNRALLK